MEPISDVFGTQTSTAAMAFGLDGVTDWSVQQPFLNVFKTARPWVAHTDTQWGAFGADDLAQMGALDDNGWITEIPAGIDRIETFILTEMPQDAAYTGGLYRLSYSGTGDISVSGAEVVSQSNSEIWFDYQPTGDGMVTISISATDNQNQGDHIRNIEVVKEDHIPAFESGLSFNPLWLDIIGDAHSLRFMDWMETNDSSQQYWSVRPQENQYSFFGGVPVEVMVELANVTGTEPWFNIPWHADATYTREFATYVRDNLDPDLRAHFELSNEVWNWMFDQAQDAHQSAQIRFGREIGDGWVQEYGARSAEMAGILDQVYQGSDDHLVKVISTHTYWPGLENAILQAPDWQAQNSDNTAPYLSFDTYAITGYFGNSLGTDAKASTVLEWISQSESQSRQEASSLGLSGANASAYVTEHRFDVAVDLAIRELRDGSVTGDAEDSLQGLFDLFRYHKTVANAHGLDLVMYEGGTHVVGIGQWVDNDTLTEFFAHLNYSDDMGQLYAELLEGWEQAGGTLFNAFVDVSDPSKWGSWGTLRHLQDETGRYTAIADFMETHPAPTHMKDGTWSSDLQEFEAAQVPDPEPLVDPFSEQSDTPTDAIVLIGTEASETLLGSELPEFFQGLGGDDRFLIGGGADTVDGGDGTDTAFLAGDRSNYTLRLSNNSIVIEDRTTDAPTQSHFQNVERFVFEDQTDMLGSENLSINLFDGMADLDGASIAALTELYIAFFNRAPDAIGLFFWGDKLASGTSLGDIAAHFFDQPEFTSLYGDLEDVPSFVTSVYQNVLGRDPDDHGLEYWLEHLENDGSIATSAFVQSIIDGAKADSGDAVDAEYLSNKTTLGGHFAVTLGMSNVENAERVMQEFDGTDNGLQRALSLSDTFHNNITDGLFDEFLMQLVGITDDPFAI